VKVTALLAESCDVTDMHTIQKMYLLLMRMLEKIMNWLPPVYTLCVGRAVPKKR